MSKKYSPGFQLPENITIKRVSFFRLLWFSKLNMEIHKEDPIFRRAQESFIEKLKFFCSFTSKLAIQHKYVIKENKKTIGALALDKKKQSVFIYAVGVRADYRKKGYGSILMKFTEEFAKKQNREFLSLSVLLENKPAVNLYEKLGYQQLGLGLTLIRIFLWNFNELDLSLKNNYEISFNKIINPKIIKEKAFHWWLKEIEALAGKEAVDLVIKESFLELDVKSNWKSYEIIMKNNSIGILVILPSEFFPTFVLFSNPKLTWIKDWIASFIFAISGIKSFNNKSLITRSLPIVQNKSSVIQIFVTQQFKEILTRNFSSKCLTHDNTEDRQIYYKKID